MSEPQRNEYPLERDAVHLPPCKNCGDRNPNNALFGARPEFIPGIPLGWYVHCKACRNQNEPFISAWNKRHNAELRRADVGANINRDA